MDRQVVIELAYLVAAMLFIVTFKLLAHPKSAVRGNLLGALGMAIAVGATLADRHIPLAAANYALIGAALAVGGVIGQLLAVKVQMTAMPQMVALLNGCGGLASLLVAGAELHAGLAVPSAAMPPWGQAVIATAASGVIGAVTFWGSLAAYAKLQEILFSRAVSFRGQQFLNAALAGFCLGLAALLAMNPQACWAYWALALVASFLGVLVTIPIGGADMPVVICLLNSYSGLAAAATGFVIDNTMLIIAGAVVGASGMILCQIMCRAMNRSLTNVLFGLMQSGEIASADSVYAGKVKSANAEEIAMLLDGARRVVIVPGYGMAVAQAQHAVCELAQLLESRGSTVEYAIHPVAGRMPGHMNILLAEADIPYGQMREMDDINSSFAETDVAVVIGANDVVNPMARTDPASPIAGMPILDVDKARTVVVIKRSLSPGFAGIPNPLFAAPNTLMYYADGKKAVLDLVAAIKLL
jgi:H+-translocating NAD(P) transhydrogenase subunit beta